MAPAKQSLNPAQKKAVTTTEGPVVVLAGAGTGKTRVVTERIAYLLRHKLAAPDRIIAVTFTNKAAGEMKERLAGRLRRRNVPPGLIVSTFHSLCLRILQGNADRIGYRPRFSICDAGEQISIVRRAMREVRGVDRLRPDDALFRISRLKCAGINPQQARRTAVEEDEQALASIYRKYAEALRAINAMDFDDLMINALQLLREDGEVRDAWQERARYLLVDEFQDTNHAQFELLKILAKRHGNLCVVGDDDQSIYAWRGACPKNIVEFDRAFPGAKIIRLEENYRSTETILKAANALIANNETRVGKTLWSRLGAGDNIAALECDDPQNEAETIVDRICRVAREEETPWSCHAVLLRTNNQTRPFEEEFRQRKIPYVLIGGTSFFDRKEVRDMLSFLQVLAFPRDDAAFLRILNVPPRGFGAKSAEALSTFAAQRRLSLADALEHAGGVDGLPAAAKKGAAEFCGVLRRARAMAVERSGDLVDFLIDGLGYQREIDTLYDDPLERASRLELARDLGNSLREFHAREAKGTLEDFLRQSMLGEVDPGAEKEKDLKQKAVRIITLHSAKGLEFSHVYLAGLQEGILPHQNALELEDIDEERRLAYVGITRARERLTLSWAASRSFRGKSIPCKPSRFIREIPQDLFGKKADARQEAIGRIQAIRAALE